MSITTIIYGYTVFLPGYWDTGTFFSFYTMVFACILFYVGWKVVKKTKLVKPHEADLIWERPLIDAYEAAYVEPKHTFVQEMLHNFGLRKVKVTQSI
jgi:yeast amino acid transporter